ncbi:MAG: hypothetical protein HYR56_30875 [Acidobacteria bacterium]|nr:hypothetical protein [Acidobacteriota bacterium]MBI3425985.1 hypothetical protein [Acidobacteriota bacterium]
MKRSLCFTLVLLLLAVAGHFSVSRIQGQGQGKDEGQGDPIPSEVLHRPNPNAHAKIGEAPTAGGTTATSPITHHGGPVIGGIVHVYLIWYGNWNQANGTDDAAGQQIVRVWANNISGSPHFNLNQTYSIAGTPVTGNVTLAGEYTDTGSQGTRLSDARVKTAVGSAIGPGKLPFDTNGVYFLLTSSNVSESSGFCSRYCGWHTAGNITSGHIRYSFVGNAARCITGCAAQSTSPNNNPGVDGMISVMTHELEEAVSDPDLNAWYDSGGAENADKCAWTFGHFQFQTANGSWANVTLGGLNFLIQRNLEHNASGDLCKVDSAHN